MTKSNFPLFTGLVEFFSKKQLKVYEKGEIILYGGTTPSEIFKIKKGHVKVYSLSEKGEEKIHMFLKENEIFPLIWPFKKQQNNLYYQAIDDVSAHVSNEESFHSLIHKDPEMMHAIVHRLIDIIDIFGDRIETLESTRSYDRLITRLLFLAKRFGKNKGKSVIIEIPINQLDIANTISMTRETVNRDIKILLEKHLISQKNQFITIRNIDLLKKELS